MRKNRFFANILLAAVTGLACLAAVLARTFRPASVLPDPSVPLLAALSLLSLLLEAYLAPAVRRGLADRAAAALLAALTFGLLPCVSGLLGGGPIVWQTALAGLLIFFAADVLFASIRDRLASGPASGAAPALSAVLLYLAVQGLGGIFL